MRHTKDLTCGPIPLQLSELMLPLILGNILQQLYNTIDAWVLGRYGGPLEYAAIGVAGSVMNLFLFAIVGGCTGISVLFAQQYGAGDLAAFRREQVTSLVCGLGATLAASAGGVLLLPGLLTLIRTPGELLPLVRTYLTIILAGLPAAFLYNLYSALLRSVGSTTAALVVLGAATGVNLGLDLLFVARLGLGVAGAAAATILAQALSALLAVLYLWVRCPKLRFGREDWVLDRPLLQKTVSFALVTCLHQSGLYIGKLLVQGAVNTGGTDLIAAYTTTTRIEGFANSFGDSGAAATSVLIAQNVGAREGARVRRSFWYSLVLLTALGLVCTATMYVTAPGTVALLLGQSQGPAFDSALGYLRIISLFYLLCFTGNTFAGYFDGLGRVTIPFVGAVSHITLRVILSWLWVGQHGLEGVAVATGLGWLWVNTFWTFLAWRGRTSANV